MSGAPAPLRSYGRRRGRPLRPGRAAVHAAALARFAVALPADGPLDPFALYAPRPDAVWLEIGFGAGEHLAWQAAANPRIGLIGCEPFVDGVAALAARLAAGGLTNVRLWPDDARPLVAALPPGSLGAAFILYPDPWPKVRHHKRRLIQPGFLALLAGRLAPGAGLVLASDDTDYLDHIRAAVAAVPALRLVRDGPRRPGDPPPTRYEAKAAAAGRPGIRLQLVRA